MLQRLGEDRLGLGGLAETAQRDAQVEARLDAVGRGAEGGSIRRGGVAEAPRAGAGAASRAPRVEVHAHARGVVRLTTRKFYPDRPRPGRAASVARTMAARENDPPRSPARPRPMASACPGSASRRARERGELAGVAPRHDIAGDAVANDLAGGAHVARHDRHGRGLRLEEDVGEALRRGGEPEDVGRVQQFGHIGPLAQKRDGSPSPSAAAARSSSAGTARRRSRGSAPPDSPGGAGRPPPGRGTGPSRAPGGRR